MSTGEGGPDESRRDLTNRARQRAGAETAFRRILAGSSAAIATMRSKASSGSLSALVEAHVPPAWRRPRRLMLVGALLLAVVVLIITTRPAATPRHPAPGTTVFPIGHQVVLRLVHSTGSVHLRAGPDGQVSITEHRSGFTGAIHTSYRQQGDVITVTVSIGSGLPTATWVDFQVAVPRDTSANVHVAAGTLKATGLTGNFVLHDTNGSISATNFRGSLDPGCHAVFRNTNGAIGVTLPSGSSVLVNARTPHGSINSEFPAVHVVSHAKGRVAKGRIGRGAPARLSIQTMGGSIDLNQRS